MEIIKTVKLKVIKDNRNKKVIKFENNILKGIYKKDNNNLKLKFFL